MGRARRPDGDRLPRCCVGVLSRANPTFWCTTRTRGATDTFYVDTSVAPETTYVYRVKAINADGVGPQSNFVNITTEALSAPPAPESLAASLLEDVFTVTWGTMSGAALYEVEWRTSGSSLSNATTTSGTVLTISPEGGPACGTTYEFTVRAYGDGTLLAAEWGEYSEPATVMTDPCNRDPEFATSTYRFSIAEDAATSAAVGAVTATDPDRGDTVTYAIASGNERGDFSVGGSTGAIAVESALDHETTPTYTLSVEASDGRGGVDTATVEIDVTDVAEDLPPAPQGLSVTLADDTFSINWNPVTGASRYEAQHHIVGSEDDWASVGTTTSAVLTYSPVDGAECGTTYEFRVRAYGDGTTYVAGWSLESDSETITTSECDRAPGFGSSFYSFSIAEDSATSTSVGTVSATDADGDTVSYSIADGNEAGKFSIGTGTGEITLEGSVDADVLAFYSLRVEASDGNGNTDTAVVGVSLLLDECSNGRVVPRPGNNPELVRDCSMLLAARDTLAGEGSLDWSAETRIHDWQGVTVHPRPFQFVRVLYLTEVGLTGRHTC